MREQGQGLVQVLVGFIHSEPAVRIGLPFAPVGPSSSSSFALWLVVGLFVMGLWRVGLMDRACSGLRCFRNWRCWCGTWRRVGMGLGIERGCPVNQR